MPKGTWIREQTNERAAHRVPRLRGPTAAGTRVTWAFMVHSHVAHTTRHVSWFFDRALPDDARCIRAPFPPCRFGPLSQPFGPKPGMGQVPGSRTAARCRCLRRWPRDAASGTGKNFAQWPVRGEKSPKHTSRSTGKTGASVKRKMCGATRRAFPAPQQAPNLAPARHSLANNNGRSGDRPLL